MKEVKLKIYKFDELSESAKKVAIQWYRDLAVDDNNLEMWEEQAKIDLAEIGFLDAEIRYCLYSQGGGVSFSSEVELEKFLPERVLKSPYLLRLVKNSVSASTTMNKGRYSFPSRGDVEVTADIEDWEYYPRIFEFLKKIEEEIADKYEEICNKLFTEAIEEDMYHSSDKCITETIEANEYDFTANGKRFQYDSSAEEIEDEP